MTMFLSYAHQDVAAVAALRQDLDDMGNEVWIDTALHGGQVWWDEILHQVRTCNVFVLAVSGTGLPLLLDPTTGLIAITTLGRLRSGVAVPAFRIADLSVRVLVRRSSGPVSRMARYASDREAVSCLAIPGRLERPTSSSAGKRSNPLSYRVTSIRRK